MVTQQIKYVSISIKEIIANDYRLEASVYNFKARLAKEALKKCKYPVVSLFDVNGFIDRAYYGGRAKRNYVKKNVSGAIGFLGSSEMLELVPNPIKFLTSKNMKIEQFKVQKNLILMSRSGTIGNLTIVNNSLAKYLISEHAIRMIPRNFGGYVYAYLNTEIGQELIKSNIYGAVISQIEPEHLQNILIPNPPDKIKQKIHDLIIKSFEIRDQCNELINKAGKILYDELKLVPLENLKPKYFDKTIDLKNYSVPLSQLNYRFDASYHLPLISEIIKTINQNAKEVKNLGSLAHAITMPGIFKRNYVGADNGVAFLGTNDIFQLVPKIEKYLSIETHKKIIEKHLSVKENTLLITDRGTIGNVVLVPKYYETENWVVSQNAIRVISDNDLIGYIFIFLNSEIGKTLIKREIYGAVIDMIDPDNAAEIPIPLLNKLDKQREINDLALRANKLRTQAFYKERKAIEFLNKEVILHE